MLETKDLILDKAKWEDWKDMYYNVWSHSESAKYMLWNVTSGEEEAKVRMEKTIAFQKSHDAYLIYEKISGQAIGFAGVIELEQGIYEEMGICFGPAFVGKGYGKQVLKLLIEYCRKEHGAREFRSSARENNVASNKVIKALGFEMFESEKKVDGRNGQEYNLLQYRLRL